MTVIQEVKDLFKIPLEGLIGSTMIHEIPMKNHERMEKICFIEIEEKED